MVIILLTKIEESWSTLITSETVIVKQINDLVDFVLSRKFVSLHSKRNYATLIDNLRAATDL